MNKHANPPNNEFPPPTPSLLNKAWANRGNPLISSATSLIHDADPSRDGDGIKHTLRKMI